MYMTDEEFDKYINEMPKYFVNIDPQTDQEFDFTILGNTYHFVLRWNAFAESSLRTPYNLDETTNTAFANRVQYLNTSGNEDSEVPGHWILDVYDRDRNPIILSVSLISGQELFDQFEYLELPGGLFAAGIDTLTPPIDYPDYNADGYVFWISKENLEEIKDAEIIGG